MQDFFCSASAVLEAAERGDIEDLRVHMAHFVLENEVQIRALARRRLDERVRSVVDSEDVLSSVLRRADAFCAEKKFAATSEEELRAFIHTVALHTSITKLRLAQRIKQMFAEGELALDTAQQQVAQCESDTEASLLVSRMMLALSDPEQSYYFALRLRGASHQSIANLLGISADAARHRWATIVRTLRTLFESPLRRHGTD